MKYGAIIEARMTSSRLPGKVVYKVNGRTMIEHLVRRLKKVKKIDKIVLATTKNKTDLILVNLAKKLNIHVFRGSENNVLQRVVGAVKKYKIQNVINITSDCPILDVKILKHMIKQFEISNCDVVSNQFIRSYPDGMDATISKRKCLIEANLKAKLKKYFEHTTMYLKDNNHKFKVKNIVARKLYWPQLGLTLDEYKDFILIKKLITYFEKKNNYFFSCWDMINLLRNDRKNWLRINNSVKRKGYDKNLLQKKLS